MAIINFVDSEAECIFNGQRSRRLPVDIQARAFRKLAQLDSADALQDLLVPLSNRLHALTGSRAGQHSISINMQWRVCFRFKDGNAHDVEITDYH